MYDAEMQRQYMDNEKDNAEGLSCDKCVRAYQNINFAGGNERVLTTSAAVLQGVIAALMLIFVATRAPSDYQVLDKKKKETKI